MEKVKRITIDFDLYKSELEESERKGYRRGVTDCKYIFTNATDYRYFREMVTAATEEENSALLDFAKRVNPAYWHEVYGGKDA